MITNEKLTKPTIITGEYNQRWNETKKLSSYHFDPTLNDDNAGYYRVIATLTGDWTKDLEKARKTHKPFYWASKSRDDEDYDYTLEEQQCLDWGIDPWETPVYMQAIVDDSYEVLNKVADALGIVDAMINVQTQYTGQMHHLHIDALAGLGPRHAVSDVQENEDEYIRVFVTLQDWTMGHIIQFGNTYYKQWKAGEVVWFPWQDTPHSTANTSHTPRTIIKLTGRKTDFTRYLLAHGHRSYEIPLS